MGMGAGVNDFRRVSSGRKRPDELKEERQVVE